MAAARSLTTAEDAALEISLAADAAQAAAATFEVVVEAEHGTLSGSGATRTYTPDADYNGPDALTFRVSQGGLTSAPATVSIAVTPPGTGATSSSLSRKTSTLLGGMSPAPVSP